MTVELLKRLRGRPLTYAARLVRVMVTLDAQSIAKAKLQGGGNLSKGIREFINRSTEQEQGK